MNRAHDIQGYRVFAEATVDTHQLSHTVEPRAVGAAAIAAMKDEIDSGSR